MSRAGWVLFGVVSAVIFSAGSGTGWHFGRAPLLAEIEQAKRNDVTEKLRRAERNAEVLQSAQQRGDTLTLTLSAQLKTIDQLTREKRDAIQKSTTGSTCLGGSALRLLHGTAGITVSGGDTATGRAVAEGGTTATDTDVAGWITDAGQFYETCRARLDALIDWHVKGQLESGAETPKETR